MAPTDSVVGEVAAVRAQALGGTYAYNVETIANNTTDYGFQFEAAAIGLAIVGSETVAGGALTFTDLGARVQASGANLVYLSCFQGADNCGFMVRDIRAEDPTVRIMLTDTGAFAPGFLQQAGPAAEGVLNVCESLNPPDFTGPAAAWYARYVARFGPIPATAFDPAIYGPTSSRSSAR